MTSLANDIILYQLNQNPWNLKSPILQHLITLSKNIILLAKALILYSASLNFVIWCLKKSTLFIYRAVKYYVWLRIFLSFLLEFFNPCASAGPSTSLLAFIFRTSWDVETLTSSWAECAKNSGGRANCWSRPNSGVIFAHLELLTTQNSR